ncbi:siderophore-interacting protein [Reinekea sp.]|jgi:NADPH-dependent ferric siderophore reductase|uniref:siderophore-interacting protein n=1 Tax=Reinekea sp. TaxID=1970455 RepID=UPI003989BE8F
MSQPSFRELTVVQSQRLTENMHRVTFENPSLADFPIDADGRYFKLLFHPETGKAIRQTQELNELDGKRPTLRTYTVRHFDASNLRMDVDFVIHGEGANSGPASSWANGSQVGDSILMGGPGPAKFVNTNADWVFLVGDMTALPAIAANLEQLANTAKGVAVIQVKCAADKLDLQKPEGIDVVWVVDPDNLVSVVKHQPWRSGTASVWVACEFTSMRALRDYFKVERETPKDLLYISSYWKQGINEEEHKIVKKQDSGI